jgi:hypothetical protein
MRIFGQTLVGLGIGALCLALPAPARAQAAKPPIMQHTAQGRDQCLMCHGGKMQNIVAVPTSHEGRENGTCRWCHAKDGLMQAGTPGPTTHTLQGRDQCLMCHGGKMPNIKAAPAESHKGIENKSCTMCHVAQTK